MFSLNSFIESLRSQCVHVSKPRVIDYSLFETKCIGDIDELRAWGK